MLFGSISTYYLCVNFGYQHMIWPLFQKRIIQSLPLESAFYTVFLAILTHKNGSPKDKISIFCFKDALTPT